MKNPTAVTAPTTPVPLGYILASSLKNAGAITAAKNAVSAKKARGIWVKGRGLAVHEGDLAALERESSAKLSAKFGGTFHEGQRVFRAVFRLGDGDGPRVLSVGAI